MAELLIVLLMTIGTTSFGLGVRCITISNKLDDTLVGFTLLIFAGICLAWAQYNLLSLFLPLLGDI